MPKPKKKPALYKLSVYVRNGTGKHFPKSEATTLSALLKKHAKAAYQLRKTQLEFEWATITLTKGKKVIEKHQINGEKI